jgi:hypothetical protein
MSDKRTLTGGCLCGAIRYEAKGTPALSAICHCRMCQRASGAPFMAVLFMPSDDVNGPTANQRCTDPRPHLTGISADAADRLYSLNAIPVP